MQRHIVPNADARTAVGKLAQVRVGLSLAGPYPHVAAESAEQRRVAAHRLREEHDCIVALTGSIVAKKLRNLHATQLTGAGCAFDEITTPAEDDQARRIFLRPMADGVCG